MTTDLERTIETVWRMEGAKIIAAVARVVRDIGLAEELAQDAIVAALEQWPQAGVPRNPAAWIVAAAKHRAIDGLRRHPMLERKHRDLRYELEAKQEAAVAEIERAVDEDVSDDLLRLVFTACHPVLAPEARVALALRLLCGLTTEEIARAFLLSESTVAQRIVRAKRTIAKAGVAFEVPRGAERASRLTSVLEVIYLVFNEGYTATAGADWIRPTLCEEALRLARTLAELTPDEPEVHGMVALAELQASRLSARVGPAGEPIRLNDQNRARWDQLLIRRGLAALARARRLGQPPGPYVLQAEIAACHARALTPSSTDWVRIAELYAQLYALTPSPVVDLNRAVAVSMAAGPQAGLDIVDRLIAEPSLQGYHLVPAVQGDLLEKLSRFDEARSAFERAAAMTRNSREQELLLARAHVCRDRTPPVP